MFRVDLRLRAGIEFRGWFPTILLWTTGALQPDFEITDGREIFIEPLPVGGSQLPTEFLRIVLDTIEQQDILFVGSGSRVRRPEQTFSYGTGIEFLGEWARRSRP